MTKVKRSGHKKSIAGCANCKRKHIKCDETRPSCVNCVTQRRRCPFLDEPDSYSAIATSHTNATNEPRTAQSSLTFDLPHSPETAVQLNLPTPWFDLINIELLQQWLKETHRSYVFNDEHARVYGPSTLNHALAFPFLMHGILANAALHLSLKHQEKQVLYRQHANKLLSLALSEFNVILPNLDSRSIVAAFLFSNITSAHQMCECFILAIRDFDNFVDRFVECLRVSRGVNVVLHGWWQYIQETELKSILSVSDQLRAEQDVERHTPEFNSIRELVHSFASMNSSETTKTYLDSIQKLQWVYNVQCALDSSELNQSMSWAFAWPMNISSDFTDLLELRRPEAIVILAHYAPLLHCRRSCWAIGKAGSSIFHLAESSLGSKWAPWLHWPREAICVT